MNRNSLPWRRLIPERKLPLSPSSNSRNVRVAAKLGAFSRLGLAALSLVLAGLWWTASQLTPNGAGLGTHQQLGLPPCSTRVLFDVRCPACGMTTSWAHLTRGEVVQAAASNVGGCLLGFLALATVPAAAWMAVRGNRPTSRSVMFLALGLVAILAVTLVDWALRLAA